MFAEVDLHSRLCECLLGQIKAGSDQTLTFPLLYAFVCALCFRVRQSLRTRPKKVALERISVLSILQVAAELSVSETCYMHGDASNLQVIGT